MHAQWLKIATIHQFFAVTNQNQYLILIIKSKVAKWELGIVECSNPCTEEETTNMNDDP